MIYDNNDLYKIEIIRKHITKEIGECPLVGEFCKRCPFGSLNFVNNNLPIPCFLEPIKSTQWSDKHEDLYLRIKNKLVPKRLNLIR